MQIRKTSEYILAYVLWAVSCASGIFLAFWAVRGALDALVELFTLGQLMGTPAQRFQVTFTRNAFDRFGVLTLGMLAVLMVVFLEHYYRVGVERGELWRRFVLVALVQVVVLFVSLVIQVALAGAMGLFTVWSIVVPLTVLAVAVALSWVLTRLPRHTDAN